MRSSVTRLLLTALSVFRRVAVAGAVVVLVLVSAYSRASARVSAPSPVRSPRAVDHVGASREVTARGANHASPTTLTTEGETLMAYPPASPQRSLAVVYLHGAHGRADRGCPWIRSGAAELGWLVCPEGVESEPNGVASWGADVFAQRAVLERALRAASRAGASPEPGVAVGFSQGSYVAVDLIKSRLARFRGLVLLAAPMHPDASLLAAAGVRRVAYGAGKQDGAYAALASETARLASEGIETRFFDLGNVGHTYAAEDTASLHEAIAWAGGLRP